MVLMPVSRVSRFSPLIGPLRNASRKEKISGGNALEKTHCIEE
jgi:hypothetical protein